MALEPARPRADNNASNSEMGSQPSTVETPNGSRPLSEGYRRETIAGSRFPFDLHSVTAL